MPALPAVPNVIKFTVEGTCGGHPWVNVLHWSYTGTLPTGATLNSVSSSLLTVWGAQFGPLMGTDCAVSRVTATDLSSSSGAQGETTDTQTGTRTGGVVPASSAVLISKHIARRYRGGHPRSYIMAGTTTDLDSPREWTAALTVAVDGAYAVVSAAMAALAVGGTNLDLEAIVSYVDATTVPAPPHRRVVPLVEPVTGVSVKLAICTQRRRLR